MMTENEKLNNGIIESYRDKFDNTHISDLGTPISKKDTFRYEIYSVLNDNNIKYTVGDVNDDGIVSDFFITNNNIYVRYNRIIQNDKGIKLKKICNKL